MSYYNAISMPHNVNILLVFHLNPSFLFHNIFFILFFVFVYHSISFYLFFTCIFSHFILFRYYFRPFLLLLYFSKHSFRDFLHSFFCLFYLNIFLFLCYYFAKAKANSSNVICIFRSSNKASSESEKAANFR